MKKFKWASLLFPLAALILLFTASVAEAEVDISDFHVTRGTVLSGTKAFGQSLAGLTKEEALDKVKSAAEKALKKKIQIQDEQNDYTGTLKDMGFSYSRGSAEKELDDYIARGRMVDRYKAAKDLQNQDTGLCCGINVTKEGIQDYFESHFSDWNCERQNASITARSGELEIVPAKNGKTYYFDEGAELLYEKILASSFGNGGICKIEIPADTVLAEVSNQSFEDFSVIGTMTTYYQEPTTEALINREQNLRTSTEHMNGTMFEPGDIISALALYGDITEENGYRPAGTFSQGKHVDDWGGGICQTTTTLYNAVLLAELEIVYRHNHSSLVTYVDPAKDAMVYAQGGSDFKFKNTSSDTIVIDAYINEEDYSLTVNIIGHEDHAEDHFVYYESEIIDVSLPEIFTGNPDSVQIDTTLPIGYTSSPKVVLKDASLSCNCSARLWKITRDGDKETREIFSGPNSNTYKGMNDIVLHSPDILVTVSADGGVESGFVHFETTWVIQDFTFTSDDPNEEAPYIPTSLNPADPYETGEIISRESIAWRIDFNRLMAEAGEDPAHPFTWPDQGSSYSFDGEQLMSDRPLPEE